MEVEHQSNVVCQAPPTQLCALCGQRIEQNQIVWWFGELRVLQKAVRQGNMGTCLISTVWSDLIKNTTDCKHLRPLGKNPSSCCDFYCCGWLIITRMSSFSLLSAVTWNSFIFPVCECRSHVWASHPVRVPVWLCCCCQCGWQRFFSVLLVQLQLLIQFFRLDYRTLCSTTQGPADES